MFLYFKFIFSFRSARPSYVDGAIGFVKIKEGTDICIVEAKVTPETSLRNAAYNVKVVINTKNCFIESSQCLDCAASLGRLYTIIYYKTKYKFV